MAWGGDGGASPQTGLTHAAELARIHHSIFDANFAATTSAMANGCDHAPPPACDVLGALSTWWRIQLDPEDRRLDQAFEREVNNAIRTSTVWSQREPERAEAWFYQGAAYGARVQWRVLRGERLAAARDGKRIKDALEQAIAIDPALHDAYFGIGLYHYYADVGPAAAKILRFLLLLPGGDRAQGLQEMLTAHDRGELMKDEADYQLHLIYLWYEHQPQQAFDLLTALHRRHPRNPLFLARMASVKDTYFHDHAESLDLYRELLGAVERHAVNEEPIADALARFGAAAELAALAEPDRAIDTLQPLVMAKPQPVFDAAARASVQIGVLEDSLGRRKEAVRAWQAGLASVSTADPFGLRERVRVAERRRPETRTAEAAAFSIEGWRAFERGDTAAAEAQLRRAAERRPDDPVIQYRLGRVWTAQREAERALTTFTRVCDQGDASFPSFVAAACYEAGRLNEASGRKTRAIDLYASVAQNDLADRATRDGATRALLRLRPRDRRDR
jgi:predicted negative regulator of RcsB-dependent stress response